MPPHILEDQTSFTTSADGHALPASIYNRPPSDMMTVTQEPMARPTMDPRNTINIPMNHPRQPQQTHVIRVKRGWSNSLYRCNNDCGTCCKAFWCPWMVYANIQSRVRHVEHYGYAHPDGGDSVNCDCLLHCGLSLLCLGCVLQIPQRETVRTRYGIRGDVCNDCMVSCCCMPCELTQESLEIGLEEKNSENVSER